jgi:hydrogenase-4 component B
VGHASAAAVGLVVGAAGVAGLAGLTLTWHVAWLVPLGGLLLVMDPLAGFFLTVIGLAAVPVSIYAIGYAGSERRGVVSYLTFLVAMAVVPLAGNVMTFALAWEAMSLASYLLVVQGAAAPGTPAGDRRATLHAGWVYAVMTHAGFVCVLAGMLFLTAWTGSTSFADWRVASTALTAGARNVAFILLGVGFAAKAGVVPLHVWLPLAHPAAPSHVSALMSGVMIKLGLYGLLRAGFDWLGTGPPWWGVLLLLAGAGSALAGVLYALVDTDLKRLLAFSSIENAGIVLLGLGGALLFKDADRPSLAALALVAALYHVVNHAAFKSLLFLGAGAVVHATGTRDLERLGGLIKRMPWTAACFLAGAAAIAALPPLNGFVSEWLTFQALLQNVTLAAPALNLVFALGIAALALTSGLAVAAFVKAFGIAFLARPRSDVAEHAHEAPGTMRAGMATLAVTCIVLGLAPTVVIPVLGTVAGSLVAAPLPALGTWLTVSIAGEFASLSMPAVALALILAAVVPLLVLVAGGWARPPRFDETWGCGRLLVTARMEYTATAFANPFTRVFDFFYRPVARREVDAHPASRLFVRRIRYTSATGAIFDEWLYRPALSTLRAVTGRVRLIQSGSANLYLAYIVAVLLALLLLA